MLGADQRPSLEIEQVTDDIADERIRSLIFDIVSWRRPPTTWSGGRAGWEPIDTGRIRGLKFKGLGLRPFEGQAALPPSTEPYDRWDGDVPDRHFGITDDGEFCLRGSDPATLGGLALSGAMREQACARDLVGYGVPSVRPVAAFRFSSLTFTADEPSTALAVSVTGRASREDRRLADLWPHGGSIEDPRRGGDAPPRGRDAQLARLAALQTSYAAFATSLRGFADAGWYRYSGHPGNIGVGPDGHAVLVDLDSCRHRSTVCSDRFALETVRDGMSGLYNLSCVFYGEHRHLIDDRSLIAHEPFSAFIGAWDPDAGEDSARRDGELIARYVVDARRRLQFFGEFLTADTPAGRRLYRHVRHDRDLTFILLFRLLFARRLARPLGHPMPFDLDDLDRRLRRFAGFERMEAITRLVR